MKLHEVLNFFTGSDYPPPLGFNIDPILRFSNTNELPTASTCALEITLPTKFYKSPDDFHEKIIYAFKNHGGLGLL